MRLCSISTRSWLKFSRRFLIVKCQSIENSIYPFSSLRLEIPTRRNTYRSEKRGLCFLCFFTRCPAAPEDSIDDIEVIGIKIAKNINLMHIFITCHPKPITIIGNIVPGMLISKVTPMSNQIHEACVEKIARQIVFFDFLHVRFDSASDPKV